MTLDEILSDLRRQTAVVRHADTGSWVASVLRERIGAGQLAPGAKLSEEALCDVLGVSRNTLREAFSTLAAEHILTRIPNRGVFVARPTVEDIREIYRVRRFLEPSALLWTPQTDAPLLHAAVARARAARDANSVDGMAMANQDFHAGVVALTGSERLSLQMAQVLAEMRLVFHSMAADPAFHEPYIERNAEILRLFEAGDRAGAVAALADYLDRAEARLLVAHAAAHAAASAAGTTSTPR
ncbi:GntR family transcriptional regulator [Cryobacterium frigoriphilum]|uniref:GntR family transcriptional regulator n=1 Tax=Cryobacterium frigoriphilum TaxID=1259150 RepID=A0A4R8ZU36_9MICO|nr:GntR family transcriptional regulator [Cryobacterium frigoriphilum]TFD45616.1 GntR family transcriptional regulator [Cryobacterium frigoriphilum]